MRRFAPRALLTAVFALSAACASGGTAGSALNNIAGGRYQVLTPDLTATGGVTPKVAGEVSETLRGLMATMATHTALSEQALFQAMEAYEVTELSEVTARQLAQQIKAEGVMWGTLGSGGAGLEADVTYIDVRTGDEIPLEGISAATPDALAQAIFVRFEESIEGIRQASFCSDNLAIQQFDRALETCNAALAIVPSSATALYGKATALLKLERTEEALDTYNLSLIHI